LTGPEPIHSFIFKIQINPVLTERNEANHESDAIQPGTGNPF
jgi:hypothetical protein